VGLFSRFAEVIYHYERELQDARIRGPYIYRITSEEGKALLKDFGTMPTFETKAQLPFGNQISGLVGKLSNTYIIELPEMIETLNSTTEELLRDQIKDLEAQLADKMEENKILSLQLSNERLDKYTAVKNDAPAGDIEKLKWYNKQMDSHYERMTERCYKLLDKVGELQDRLYNNGK
jgi:regulator of replication initiation timing